MTKTKLPLLGLALSAVCGLASAQSPISGTISVIRPGVYGRIDIGQQPPPPVVYAQPVLIAPPPVVAAPVVVAPQPLYLYVPPGHQKNWRHYCGYYHACGQPVYFVQEGWVREHYEREHGHGRGHDEDHDHGHGHGHDRDD